MGVVALIVLEPGSDWPGELGGDYDGLIALIDDGETVLDRVRERLAALARAGDRLGTAVLSCSATVESVRRRTLANVVSEALVMSGHGPLVLRAAAGSPPALRHELCALAMGLGGATPLGVAVDARALGTPLAPPVARRERFEPLPASA